MAKPAFIVVGGGLAGLMTTIRLAEAGHKVDLLSFVPVKRSHSVCAQGGINGAVNVKGEGDSPWEHFDDSVYGGDFLANQPPVKKMCDAAPGIIYLLDRMGVMFNRTAEGLLDFRRFGGTKHHRTAFAGATTGQQMLYSLDEQVRRYEVDGLVKKYEFWEFLAAVIDDKGVCRGCIALNQIDMKVHALRADAVMLATGGPGVIFGRGTNSTTCTGTAASAAYQQGVHYANGEFIQVHPTAIPGTDKLRLMSESARGEGGRIWVPKDVKDKRSAKSIPESERWYFLEDMYPAYGNLVPRDIASRAIYKVCRDMGMGIGGSDMVYLDVTHIPRKELDRKLGGILEIYEKFVGDDPHDEPMKIFPAYHYSMGGIWIDFDHMTNVPGLFAAGECEYQYHGANRLGANSLLSCIIGGEVAAAAMAKFANGLEKRSEAVGAGAFDAEKKRQEEIYTRLRGMSGSENPFVLGEELAATMRNNVSIVRENDKLKATDAKILELKERFGKLGIPDKGQWMNQSLIYMKQLFNMLELARVIALGALARDESRGAHYKPAFPDRDDPKWLKTTKAAWSAGGPVFSYEPVDISLLPLRVRKYDVDKKAAGPAATGAAKG
ncbi:MAG: succinate dehydrogenase flavoprotein subunit [Acidobacteria bacterium]|nr:succinate dehydrogenase flavoprotein subunit [Acidobacteriota bacterium]